MGGEDAYNLVDRDAMWHWLGRLKQPDGGFRVTEGGEEDVRGAYCALVAISLLDLPLTLPPESPAREAGLETFFDGLGEYLSRCQTYEGESEVHRETKHMVHMHSVLLPACVSMTHPTERWPNISTWTP